MSGRAIAEWVMNNRGSLNLKYVIWGQKIWTPGQDAVKSWTSWRTMEDRGDVTQNHWYALSPAVYHHSASLNDVFQGPCACQLQLKASV